MKNKIEFKTLAEYKLSITSNCNNIIDSFKELMTEVDEHIELKPFAYGVNNSIGTILVSKFGFESYLAYLENYGFFIRTNDMTGKSIQLTFLGYPVCINTKLDPEELEFVGTYILEYNIF